jgi:hypothetical protein
MFNVGHPPLLVIPVGMKQAKLFPENEGYNLHTVSPDEAYVCYKTGWTFPLSVDMKNSFGAFTEKPLMLVRDKGRATAQGVNFLKGYAHTFVTDDGNTPDVPVNKQIFPDDKHTNWLLVSGYVNVIWLQYGYRSQTAVGPVTYQEQMDYGKILILKLEIVKDNAPRLDKKADVPEMHDIQYRVSERQLLYEDWSVKNQNPMIYIGKMLDSKGLGVFKGAVAKSLSVAGCSHSSI